MKFGRKIISDFFIERKYLSIAEFEKLFDYTRINTNSFFDFIENEISCNLKNKLAPGTLQTYKTQISKLRKFRQSIEFYEIDVTFLAAYEKHMIVKLKNENSTIDKSFRFLRTVYYKAIEQRLTDSENNPFRSYQWLKPKQSDRRERALTINEINRLQAAYDNEVFNKSFQNVLKYFLFGCYTGLRYSDILRLKYKDIQEEAIKMKMKKTSDFVSIPISEKAKCFIGSGFNEQKVFRVLSDQPTNRHLKYISENVGINKPVSFHWSRHTFATTCIELGFNIEIIKELLGHTSLKSTQIYSKVSDNIKQQEMAKWNKL